MNLQKIADWLRVFRAQTAPATILLVLTGYLTAKSLYTLEALILLLYCLFIHWISFGHNSLMDTAMGYDLRDPSKKHHPLVAHRIKLSKAHNVIHWSLGILAILGAIISIYYSPAPLMALFCLLMFYAWGHAYNDGLDKESLLSFVPISLCFTFLGAWGWFLGNRDLSLLGITLIAYYFFTILFQIAWSGHLKELQIRERSNLLIKLGAKLDVNWKGEKIFIPGNARYFGWSVKIINLIIGFFLMIQKFTLVRLVISVILGSLVIYQLNQLTKKRIYNRGKELFNMSIMEILTIYFPLPIVLDYVTAIILMIFGVVYFFGINKILWKVPYPKV